MATNAETVAATGGNSDDAPELDENGQPLPAGEGEGEGEGDEGGDEPEPITSLAESMGWVPKERYSGPPEMWKPATQFIRDGRDIQRSQSTEIKNMRQTLDTLARTTGVVVESTVRDRIAALQTKFEAAVEEGNATEAFKIGREIDTVRANIPASNGVGQPSPEASSWAERNSSWFKKDPLATARAIEITNNLAAAGFTDHAQQLDAAEKQVRKEFPHLFGGGQAQGKPPAGVHTPSGRGPGAKPSAETFAALPKAAQDIAADLEARGLTTKDAYVKNYFANMKAKG